MYIKLTGKQLSRLAKIRKSRAFRTVVSEVSNFLDSESVLWQISTDLLEKGRKCPGKKLSTFK